ncbi:LapA family protein [Acidovorax sp.]|uniref:LapA family protein n=1 Tax=Acidovorax sp. TaxID=1872122 RepID=UPI00391FA8EF
MQLRSIVLVLTTLAIAVLAVFNWAALSATVPVYLGVTTLEAPLGLLMLGLTGLLAIVGVVYVLSLQGSVLLETRRHTKELQAQRELADKAEASRFTELRAFLETQHQQMHTALLARMDHLETRLAARAQESDNTTAAYVGQLEKHLRARGADMHLV